MGRQVCLTIPMFVRLLDAKPGLCLIEYGFMAHLEAL